MTVEHQNSNIEILFLFEWIESLYSNESNNAVRMGRITLFEWIE